MTKECRHTYNYTYLDLMARSSVFSKKTCDKCGATIVMDVKSKLVIVLYLAACCAAFTWFIKSGIDMFALAQYGSEVKYIAFFAFLSALLLGIKFILNKAKYITYKSK